MAKSGRTYSFKSIGENVIISERASIYGSENISIGNNVRIDDFAVLSAVNGELNIGSYVHIGCGSSIIGAGVITIGDHVNISGGVRVYSSTDDFSGDSLCGPMVAKEFRKIITAPVLIGRHTTIGANAVVLPGAVIMENVGIGAESMVKGTVNHDSIYGGIPARRIGSRTRGGYKVREQMEKK
jgi:galactoside O-acetyltransferase